MAWWLEEIASNPNRGDRAGQNRRSFVYEPYPNRRPEFIELAPPDDHDVART
jgi:hypothetical protein